MASERARCCGGGLGLLDVVGFKFSGPPLFGGSSPAVECSSNSSRGLSPLYVDGLECSGSPLLGGSSPAAAAAASELRRS
jgi:hypothetical protein